MGWQGARFSGRIGYTTEQSEPAWRMPPRAQPDDPNVVVIVLDDVGFAHLGCFGSDLDTPVMDSLADAGVRYTRFHTAAMCSPTRAALLTGRNHHTNGLGMISELAQGYPGYDGVVPETSGMIAQVLKERGYATYAVGKWHLTPSEEVTAAGPFDRWPLGKGFERFFGFLGGETNQYAPDLVRDNTLIDADPDDGRHLTEILVDEAIRDIRDLRSVDPDKPFFLYFCPGACHAPHQAPREYIDRYRGRFDQGWDTWRERTFARQRELGLFPPETELSPRPDWIPAWDSLSEPQRRLYARMMEVFAGFLTHTDEQIGRLMTAIDRLGERENTLVVVVSDNGASGEGGFDGSVNEVLMFNGLHASLDENLAQLDELGGPQTYGHYPVGWTMAGNTPFRRWKRQVHNGGIADPFILSWPRAVPGGGIRHQYIHAVDVPVTILDLLGTEFPAMLRGVPQEEVAGVSFAASLTDADAPQSRRLQYYEMYGSRALYRDGYKAVTFHAAPPAHPSDGPGDPDASFFDDAWELYDVRTDPSEVHDLAEALPRLVEELKAMWHVEAGRYGVLPLHARQHKGLRPSPFGRREVFRYWPGTSRIDNEAAVDVRMRSFSVVADVRFAAGDRGVLVAQGGRFGGWTLYVDEDRLHFEHNYLGRARYRVRSAQPIPAGDVLLGLEFAVDGTFEISPALSRDGIRGVRGTATVLVDGTVAGQVAVERTVPFNYGLTGEGFCCGFDSETPVSDRYEAPFPYTGLLREVLISPHGEPVTVLQKQLERAYLVS
ncbi:arylsulfatase [Microbacterium luticocti]|uniref:arylsulfatase n=1 Tax=Microbacterium luticocti TaxID=451764 RepID=UPI000425530C|nr:arylsulfatase [Microbacterium luticocti]